MSYLPPGDVSTSLRDHMRAPLAVGSPWIGWSAAAAVEQKIFMTFYEAALQILQREGKPLHANEITELAVKDNLLSHVGKQPEITMASRLAAMARRSQDRRLVAVEPDIFGLTDWDVEPSSEALDQSGLPEAHDEEEPPLRGRERHPKIDKENVRVAGRSDRRRKYEEADRRKKKKVRKRQLPLPELVHEILEICGRAVSTFELAAAIREHDLLPDDIGREALEKALQEENVRRVEEERSEAFRFYEGGKVGIYDGPEPVEDDVDEVALVTSAVEKIAGERKPELPVVAAVAEAVVPAGSVDAWVADHRERAIRQLRQGLLALDTQGLEALTQNLLETLGYRDVRIAKRHKDGSLFTCRRRMGLTEVRFALRVIRGGKDVRREDVIELRRDMASHSAQMGVLLSPSDATREARSEVGAPGQPLVTLLSADALVEQMIERGLGVTTRTVTVVQFDEAGLRHFIGQGTAAPAEAQPTPQKSSAAERRERREKERREWRERREKEREERRRLRAAEAAAKAQAEAPGTAGIVGAEEPILGEPVDVIGAERPILGEQTASAEAAEPGIALAGATTAAEPTGEEPTGEELDGEDGDEATADESTSGGHRTRRRRRGRGQGGSAAAATEAATTEAAATEAAATEAATSEAATSEAAAPEAAAPEAATSEAAAPEAVTTEAVTTEAAATEAMATEVTATEATATEVTATEVTATEVTGTEVTAPDAAGPEAATTEAPAPRAAAPESGESPDASEPAGDNPQKQDAES